MKAKIALLISSLATISFSTTSFACVDVTGSYDCHYRPFQSPYASLGTVVKAKKVTIKKVTSEDPELAQYKVTWELKGEHLVEDNSGVPFSGSYEDSPFTMLYPFRWSDKNDGTGGCVPDFDPGSNYTLDEKGNLDYKYSDWGIVTHCERIQ